MEKGDKYQCQECGLETEIETPCSCVDCDLVCCDKPMKKVEKSE